MRADVCVYFEKELPVVYRAYVEAITKHLGKECKEEPYHTITFALNYSFRYNMNGGACTVRLMPHKNGTAVNLRYTIAQAWGANYEGHSSVLHGYVEAILHVNGSWANIPVERFTLSENQITPEPDNTPQPDVPAAPSAPVMNYAEIAKTLSEFKSLLDAGVLTQEEFDKIKENLLTPLKTGFAVEKSEPAEDNTPVSAPVEKVATRPDPNNPNKFICTACGTSQPNNRGVCFQCGAKLK